ncbi:helix-turn-helix domain-containing protein [Brevibacterium sp. UCMA 11754]|uniref:helix-turn-helix domain-containing protein n=1 Tax=Brevibacterium sp. UCMA 11754 TaxID=2749198 RepID=UPI001F1AE7BC|nr:MerR family transcriptional regulator [Brevibacterium sp. UCMA 11754]MCF2573595.1 MerR family transcriptional regulator [Brevibacterium sp. UCMA 11754]
MGWSTSELARLTGTTVNTIRHYHKLDLLAEPERMSNGYKQYGAAHLLRLLQIRRMRDLGIPLTDIDSVASDHEQQQLALKQLDRDLGERIAELEKARTEIAEMVTYGAPIDTASGFIDIAARMSAADRSLMSLYSNLYDESAMAEMKSIMSDSTPYDQEVDELPDDADEATRVRLAEQIVPSMKSNLEAKPWMLAPTHRMHGDAKMGQAAIIGSITELYNPAQIDVIQRAFLQVFPTLDIPDEDRARFIAFITEMARDEGVEIDGSSEIPDGT